jgi:hypothetical protein
MNRSGLTLAHNETSKVHPFIIETGTSTYGTDTTRLLDRFASMFSGEFHSVDLNSRAAYALLFLHGSRTTLYTSDA